ncbi:MAG: metal-dependent hydrolase [Deferribacteres bacterium]|nr:metal-dependent hydrolase [candidate division KSB1 bacterium]MCB9503359.1 metal-dependent hydrolase [Deferribacteres bacterium]
MPLPVAHGMAGISIYFWGHEIRFFKSRFITVLFFAFVACLPDADFLPGWLQGNPNLYHPIWSHSLGAALVVAGLFAWLFARRNGHFKQYFVIFFSLYYSHIILDFFNNDTREPFGIMAFWPFNSTYFLSPWPLFDSVQKSSDSNTFIASVLSGPNFIAATKEFFIMLPFVLYPIFLKRKNANGSGLR